MNSKTILELVGKIEKLIPSNEGGIKDDIKSSIKILIEDLNVGGGGRIRVLGVKRVSTPTPRIPQRYILIL